MVVIVVVEGCLASGVAPDDPNELFYNQEKVTTLEGLIKGLKIFSILLLFVEIFSYCYILLYFNRF